MKKWFLLLLMVLLPVISKAQVATIVNTVTLTGSAVQGAVVSLIQNGSTVYSSISDFTGIARFTSIVPGTYTVQISGPGITTQSYLQTFGSNSFNPSLASCALVAGVVNVQVPPGSGQSSGISNQCVGVYSAVEANSTQNFIWGMNPVAILPPGQPSGFQANSVEADVDVSTTNSGVAIGENIVNISGFKSGETITSSTTQPTRGSNVGSALTGASLFVIGYACGSYSIACYSFDPEDTGLEITQSITSSASPQTVTTNAEYGKNQLNPGSYISIDTGTTREDVQILSLSSSPPFTTGQPYSITAVFTQNHSNGTSFFQYNGLYGWYGVNCVALVSCYHLGDLRQYENTANPLGWDVIDTTGTQRIYDFFSSNSTRDGGSINGRVFRDIGSGWSFENESGSVVLQLTSTELSSYSTSSALDDLVSLGRTSSEGVLALIGVAGDQIAGSLTGDLTIRNNNSGNRIMMGINGSDEFQMNSSLVTIPTVPLQLLNGSSSADTLLEIGRTSTEGVIALIGVSNDQITGSLAGDLTIRDNNSGNKIMMGVNGVDELQMNSSLVTVPTVPLQLLNGSLSVDTLLEIGRTSSEGYISLIGVNGDQITGSLAGDLTIRDSNSSNKIMMGVNGADELQMNSSLVTVPTVPLQLLNGSSSADTLLEIGRTSSEGYISLIGVNGDQITGAVAGDLTLRNNNSSNKILMGINGANGFQITAAGPMAGAGIVVGSLPSASSNPGVFLYVTDSTSISAEGQTCVGSSTNKALAFSNGSVWKCF